MKIAVRFATALLAAFALALPASGGEMEAKVKAAYLFHLTKFVEWPGLIGSELHICIVGADDIGALMGELSSRQVGERRLKIDVEPSFDLAQCQVLFLGHGTRRQVELLRRPRSGVLTVGDGDDFARQGGIVGFYTEAGKIKLEINPETARAAGLRISAKLLEMARLAP